VSPEAHRRRVRPRERQASAARRAGEPGLRVRHAPTVRERRWVSAVKPRRPTWRLRPHANHPSAPTGPKKEPGGASTGFFGLPQRKKMRPLVRPARCMTPNQSVHPEKGERGTAGHGDTVAEATIRPPRSNVPERAVQRTRSPSVTGRENRRHDRRTMPRRHSPSICGHRTSPNDGEPVARDRGRGGAGSHPVGPADG
jgi:hypothetical protein